MALNDLLLQLATTSNVGGSKQLAVGSRRGGSAEWHSCVTISCSHRGCSRAADAAQRSAGWGRACHALRMGYDLEPWGGRVGAKCCW